MSHSILPLVTLWEEFFQKNKSDDVKEFARWILQNETIGLESDLTASLSNAIKASSSKGDQDFDEGAKALLLISRLQRFLQRKTKPIIKKLGFTKDHEYSMLTYIYLLKNPNKKELAQNMLLENSTAVEITNRILKRGLIKEIADNGDKRSTRLELTAEGEKKLYESYSSMKELPASFLKNITNEEIKLLVFILQKIENGQG